MIVRPTAGARTVIPPGPVKPDVERIFELINVWDHRCHEPRACPHRSWATRGATTRFARRIGRHRQTLWNMRAGNAISATLAMQLADVLHVDVTEIAEPETDRLAA